MRYLKGGLALAIAAVVTFSPGSLEGRLKAPVDENILPGDNRYLSSNPLAELTERDIAIRLIELGIQNIAKKEYEQAYNNFAKSLEIFSRIQKTRGDLEKAAAALGIGQLLQEVADAYSSTDKSLHERFLKYSIGAYEESRDAIHFDYYFIPNKKLKSPEPLRTLNTILSIAYEKLKDYKAAAYYALENLKLVHSDINEHTFTDIAARVPEPDFDELVRKIKTSFDKTTAERLLKTIETYQKGPKLY